MDCNGVVLDYRNFFVNFVESKRKKKQVLFLFVARPLCYFLELISAAFAQPAGFTKPLN